MHRAAPRLHSAARAEQRPSYRRGRGDVPGRGPVGVRHAAADVALLLDTNTATCAGSARDNTLETAITLAASVAAYARNDAQGATKFY